MRRGFSRLLRGILFVGIGLALLAVLAVGAAELCTYCAAEGRCHDKAADCPSGGVGLVLGCARYLGPGRPNFYFTGRMQAAAELWRSGKVRCLIVSGDNRFRCYNEPREMRRALVALGVPSDRIVCDYAGLCTYDSVVRAHRIFGAQQLVIVSQPEHAARAVAIAHYLDIPAEGLNAPLKPTTRSSRFRHFVRERGARVAMLYDLITGRTPRHMGAPETLPN